MIFVGLTNIKKVTLAKLTFTKHMYLLGHACYIYRVAIPGRNRIQLSEFLLKFLTWNKRLLSFLKTILPVKTIGHSK